MKKLIEFKIRLLSTAFLFAILVISNSCNKSSYNNMTGMTGNTGGTGGPGTNEVFIQGMAFNPSTISITTNTTITWTNKDAVGHTVTSDTGLFDSGTIGTNGTYSFTFVNAGTYTYHCKIHPAMIASVIVSTPSTTSTVPGY